MTTLGAFVIGYLVFGLVIAVVFEALTNGEFSDGPPWETLLFWLAWPLLLLSVVVIYVTERILSRRAPP